MSETIFDIVLLLLSVPTLLFLSVIHVESRNRSISATDDMVTTGLIREKKEQELKVYNESFQNRLDAIRRCEISIYGTLPDSEHPERIKAVVSPQRAREHLDEFLVFYENEEKRYENQKRKLEIHLEEKKKHLQELNRGFRTVDRVLDVSALVLRAALVLAILYSLGSLLFGLVR